MAASLGTHLPQFIYYLHICIMHIHTILLHLETASCGYEPEVVRRRASARGDKAWIPILGIITQTQSIHDCELL